MAVKKLANGGIVYEMDSNATAAWLRGNTAKDKFLEAFGPEANIKPRTYTMIAEFVPCEFDTSTAALAIVESNSKLAINTIMEARWIRQVQFRKPGQKVAHMTVMCATREAANAVIANGLIIEGKKITVRKKTQEPLRCLKCQFFGKNHKASECKQIHDTCGSCASLDHRTSQCREDPAKYNCVNCAARTLPSGHASWDRLCPIYKEYKSKIEDHDHEAKYKFFPTEDPNTWTKTEGNKNQIGEAGRSRPLEGTQEREARRGGTDEWRRGDTRQPFQRRQDAGWGQRTTRMTAEHRPQHNNVPSRPGTPREQPAQRGRSSSRARSSRGRAGSSSTTRSGKITDYLNSRSSQPSSNRSQPQQPTVPPTDRTTEEAPAQSRSTGAGWWDEDTNETFPISQRTQVTNTNTNSRTTNQRPQYYSQQPTLRTGTQAQSQNPTAASQPSNRSSTL